MRNLGRDADLLVQSWGRAAGSAVLLRDQDLIVDPPRALGSLLSQLGLPANEIVVERMLTMRPRTPSAAGRHIRRAPPRPSRSGAGKPTSIASLQAVCDEAFGKALEAFGYHEDLDRAKAASS